MDEAGDASNGPTSTRAEFPRRKPGTSKGRTSSVPLVERIHECVEALQVEVVGRLVEDEDVRPLHAQDGERHARLLPSREGPDQLQRGHALWTGCKESEGVSRARCTGRAQVGEARGRDAP